MALQLQKPKELRAQKPVRVIFTGGFLGAGKTTALGAIARRLLQRGLTDGLVTNDQAANLVDTAIVKELGVPVAEVAGGIVGSHRQPRHKSVAGARDHHDGGHHHRSVPQRGNEPI